MTAEYIDPFLEKQFSAFIDEQLKEHKFDEICKSIAGKILDKVSYVEDPSHHYIICELNEEEQVTIKNKFSDIERRLELLLSEQQRDDNELPTVTSTTAATKNRRLGGNQKIPPSVIVIDDDDDDAVVSKESASKTMPNVTSDSKAAVKESLADITNVEINKEDSSSKVSVEPSAQNKESDKTQSDSASQQNTKTTNKNTSANIVTDTANSENVTNTASETPSTIEILDEPPGNEPVMNTLESSPKDDEEYSNNNRPNQSLLKDPTNDAFFGATAKDGDCTIPSVSLKKETSSPSVSTPNTLTAITSSPSSTPSKLLTVSTQLTGSESPWNSSSAEFGKDLDYDQAVSLTQTLNEISEKSPIESLSGEDDDDIDLPPIKLCISIPPSDKSNDNTDEERLKKTKKRLSSPIIVENDSTNLKTKIRMPGAFKFEEAEKTSTKQIEKDSESLKRKKYRKYDSDTESNQTVSNASAYVNIFGPKMRKDRSALKMKEKVYAKPDRSDIWYQAEIIKEVGITNKEKKYHVRFTAGQRLHQKIPFKNVASMDPIDPNELEIGSRVVAGRPSDTVNSAISKYYKDFTTETDINVMFAGIIAELACESNRFRYLVFFDDGYAQYIPLNRMYPVVGPSDNVWEDVGKDCRDFIKEYLKEYPYRCLVVMSIGNSMQTEWNGEWWKSKVVSIDSSLVKILFDIDKRSEWIYRGTSRLEPLYDYFMEPSTQSNRKRKKKMNKETPYVDEKITHPQFGISRYSTRDPEGKEQMKFWNITVPTAQKTLPIFSPSSTKSKRPVSPLPITKPVSPAWSTSSSSSSKSSIIHKAPRKKKRIHSESESETNEKDILDLDFGGAPASGQDIMISSQEALGVLSALQMSPANSDASTHSSKSAVRFKKRSISMESEGKAGSPSRSRHSNIVPKTMIRPHKCSPECVTDRRNLFKEHRKGKYNYLAIPLQLGWKRESAKRHNGYHRDIYYRTPCDKRMRNLADITNYLLKTKSTNVCIDMFCFQSNTSCRNQPVKSKIAIIRIDDLSNRKENVPVVCVNEISDELPNPVTYVNKRIKADDVSINTDPGFLTCCDCTDFCQDKTKCACAQSTIESTNAIDGVIDPSAGYSYRRLKDCITTGIYECNQNCSCAPQTCYNRVVQNGIQLRLQVFLTENRGWGLRCIDDIPKGAFICTYTGQVLNEQTANREGMDYGDEYLAELDHIEVVEKAKDGYESDVPELRESRNIYHSSDSDSDSSTSSGHSTIYLSSDEGDSSSEDLDNKKVNNKLITGSADFELKNVKIEAEEGMKSQIIQDEPHVNTRESHGTEEPDKKQMKVEKEIEARKKEAEINSTCSENKEKVKDDTKPVKAFAKKSTGQNADTNLMFLSKHRKTSGGKNFTSRLPKGKLNREDGASKQASTRKLYGPDNELFIIDAKSYGNVGRYMNHSCSPNSFVQNIMVDTHDLRFPWVAFFAQQNIPALTELTWDYNYEVGSVPDKELICKCGSKQCKGRLL